MPDAPRTGGPAARGPGGPATPGAAPAARGPGGGVGRRGTAMTISRGETSKKFLQIDWDHPVWKGEQDGADKDGNGTTAAVVRRALPLEQAIEAIAGDDPRPMLVLRECFLCQGSDAALLSRELSNDRTLLLTNWFHCVKLPANTTDENHPFRNLFPGHSHLFLSLADGSERMDMDGKQTQSQLWPVMGKLLDKAYEGKPEKTVKELLQLLAQFDRVDEEEARLLMELDGELDKRETSSRVTKLQAELKAVNEERRDLLEKHKALSELRLKESIAAAGK